MKKKAVLMVLWALIVLPSYIMGGESKRPVLTDSERQAFSRERAEFTVFLEGQGFKKQDIAIMQKKGYSPYVSFLFLRVAAVSGKPAARIMKYREHGYSLGEICEKAGIDYKAFITATNKYVADNNIVFPAGNGDEMNMDAATMPKTEVPE